MRALVAVLVVTVVLGVAFAVLVATRTLPFLDDSRAPACAPHAHPPKPCAPPTRGRR